MPIRNNESGGNIIRWIGSVWSMSRPRLPMVLSAAPKGQCGGPIRILRPPNQSLGRKILCHAFETPRFVLTQNPVEAINSVPIELTQLVGELLSCAPFGLARHVAAEGQLAEQRCDSCK